MYCPGPVLRAYSTLGSGLRAQCRRSCKLPGPPLQLVRLYGLLRPSVRSLHLHSTVRTALWLRWSFAYIYNGLTKTPSRHSLCREYLGTYASLPDPVPRYYSIQMVKVKLYDVHTTGARDKRRKGTNSTETNSTRTNSTGKDGIGRGRSNTEIKERKKKERRESKKTKGR